MRPLIGFRCWHVDGPLLLPENFFPNLRPRPWSAFTATEARCISHISHDAPDAGCNCGLHAYYELYPHLTTAPRMVAGAIVAWGRVVEHERGFRAQYARPLALLDARSYRPAMNHNMGPSEAAIRAVADAYDVPVLDRLELDAYARWHGQVVSNADVAWTRLTEPWSHAKATRR